MGRLGAIGRAWNRPVNVNWHGPGCWHAARVDRRGARVSPHCPLPRWIETHQSTRCFRPLESPYCVTVNSAHQNRHGNRQKHQKVIGTAHRGASHRKRQGAGLNTQSQWTPITTQLSSCGTNFSAQYQNPQSNHHDLNEEWQGQEFINGSPQAVLE